jgi:pre-mRNA-splicing factor 38A
LTRQAKDVYRLLEGYLGDYRKLKRKGRMGSSLTYMDAFVDDLLVKERVCGTTLWKMPKREVLEDLDVLEPRVSPLGDIEDLLESEPEEVEGENGRSEDSEGGGRGSPGSEFGEVTPEMDEMDVDREKETENGD